jgi:hypothetical protein
MMLCTLVLPALAGSARAPVFSLAEPHPMEATHLVAAPHAGVPFGCIAASYTMENTALMPSEAMALRESCNASMTARGRGWIESLKVALRETQNSKSDCTKHRTARVNIPIFGWVGRHTARRTKAAPLRVAQ